MRGQEDQLIKGGKWKDEVSDANVLGRITGMAMVQ